MIIGIDPGLKGAIAFLKDDGNLVINDLPLRQTASGKKTIHGGDLHAMVSTALSFPFHSNGMKKHVVALECVNAMPHDGVVSAFNFGKSTGIIVGVLASLNLTIIEPPPAVWKNALGLGTNKKDSLALAKKTFPKYHYYFERAKDDGRAEAALIAHFVKRAF